MMDIQDQWPCGPGQSDFAHLAIYMNGCGDDFSLLVLFFWASNEKLVILTKRWRTAERRPSTALHFALRQNPRSPPPLALSHSLPSPRCWRIPSVPGPASTHSPSRRPCPPPHHSPPCGGGEAVWAAARPVDRFPGRRVAVGAVAFRVAKLRRD